MIFWKHRPRDEDVPVGLCYNNFTYPKNAAILNKFANIFPSNVINIAL